MPYAVQRIGRAGEVVRAGRPADPGLVDGTAERMEVWKASLEVIRDHPVLGTGTGDVKDELIGKYSRDGMEGAFSQKLNAHNQYLQTFAALGIGGFLVLAAMILLPFLDAIRKRDLLYLMFLLVFGLNIAVESMLETQAGVVFYAFFNSFLLWNSQNRDPEAAS
jgi:O-antigen ligase